MHFKIFRVVAMILIPLSLAYGQTSSFANGPSEDGEYVVELTTKDKVFYDEMSLKIGECRTFGISVCPVEGTYTVPGIFTAPLINGKIRLTEGFNPMFQLTFEIVAKEVGGSYSVNFSMEKQSQDIFVGYAYLKESRETLGTIVMRRK